MFNIILCDDNPSFLEMEKKIIEKIFVKYQVEGKITCLHSGEELLALQNEIANYHLIFLDVEMNEWNGIDVLKRIRMHSDISVAFVSTYIDYALEGYHVNAIRYILKETKGLEAALEECFQAVYERRKTKVFSKMILCREKNICVTNKNLIMAESRLHYVYLHILQEEKIQEFSLRGTLDALERQLSFPGLLRTHKSHLVNVAYVDYIKRYYVKMKKGNTVPIAQGKYDKIRLQYAKYQGEML